MFRAFTHMLSRGVDPLKGKPERKIKAVPDPEEVEDIVDIVPIVWYKVLYQWVRTHRWETAFFVLLLAISIVAHAWNMFSFPYIENDEATYTSRAWAFISEGKLDVYTYRYDHAPLGWMLLGAWQFLAAGEHVFGSLINSGRVFMLALHILSTILVYILAKRFSGGSRIAAGVAVLFFALSPIAIYFQRRILLDNIMTFWLLVSAYLATQPVARLKYFIWSGITFGVATLTKLNAVFLAPAFLYIVWIRAHKQHRIHASFYWLTVAGMVIGSFFLYALLKGELFAAPVGADGMPAHVSVVDTFSLQLGRGEFAWPWEYRSSFQENIRSWLIKDWAILSIGAAATLVIFAVGLWRRTKQPLVLALALIVLLYVAFLARGKIVLDLYIVPLLPFLALSIGVAVSIIHNSVLRLRLLKDVFIVVLALGLGALFAVLPYRHYTVDETTNQLRVVDWVKQHVPEDAVIATDNYLYPYLSQEEGYRNVSYFFTTEYDPEIRKTYQNDWRNVEYLVLTHEIIKQIKTGTVPRMKNILDHATLVADYRTNASSYIDLPNYISTNGDWAQVYKIKSRNDIVLQDSWRHFKSAFVVDYGQVIDPTNNDLTTSSGQAQAMLRAVSQHDKQMFGGLWQWSKDHLRYRSDDKLLSWKWEKQADNTFKLTDSNNVCDADQQIAYALFLAAEQWPDKGYDEEARVHAADWYRKCTFERNGARYIDSSADGSQDSRLLNTGYFRPHIYHYLAERLPELAWNKLIDDGYALLDRVNIQYGTMPNWTVMLTDGSLQSATGFIGAGADNFGYDALQLVPNLVADIKDARAVRTLTQLNMAVAQFAAQTQSLPAHGAQLLLRQALPGADKAANQRLYERTIYKEYRVQGGYWQQRTNYLDQVWMWQWHYMQSSLPTQQPSLK